MTALDLPSHGPSPTSIPDPSVPGLALAIAFSDPGRVRSVTLVCPAGLGAEINRDYIDGFVSSASRRQLKRVLENLFADAGLVDRSLVDGVLKYKRPDGVTESLDSLVDGVFPGDAQSWEEPGAIAGLDVPVLVVWSAEDRIVPAAHADAAAGATVEIVEGAGHMVQMEAVPRVNALITAHISRAAGSE